MTKVQRRESVSIAVDDEASGQVFAVHIGERGITSTSGQLLAVKGSGERVPIEALQLLEAVFDEGIRFGQKGPL